MNNSISNFSNQFVFLQGPAGSGKTTAGVERLRFLLKQGVPGHQILVWVPQRTLGAPYAHFGAQAENLPGSPVDILTLGGLARRMCDLFWPLVAQPAGFAHPERPPVFLTIESAQYFMAQVVNPLIEQQGYFESVILDKNRLYSQILDNLNKAAVVGFAHTQIGARLKSAWIGEPSQKNIYDNAQECANLFRDFCLEHNLLDFSLQIEMFLKYIWPSESAQTYLRSRYRHLIVDNVEEDTPAAHDILLDWLPSCKSALFIMDSQAGFRSFLGADPVSAERIRAACGQTFLMEDSLVCQPPILTLTGQLDWVLAPDDRPRPQNRDIHPALEYQSPPATFFPGMLDWVAEKIDYLVHHEHIPPGEIVVLAPFLSDALRFSLMHRLEDRQVPVQSHRPSRPLREEPATQCLLNLSALAHPDWEIPLTAFDVAYALMQAIEGLDLVRAQLLAEGCFRINAGQPLLEPFESLPAEIQQRISYQIGQRYERLRIYLQEVRNRETQTFDHFLSQLFGELLSQPGFGFHTGIDAGIVTSDLITSIKKFRWAAEDTLSLEAPQLGREYLRMVQQGVIAAQYIPHWQAQTENAVLLAPAYTFLLSNRPVDVQFWLNVNSSGWWERLYQPLTHPYVLSRNRPDGQPWTDADEFTLRRQTLHRLTIGLLRRCRRKIYLGLSNYNEQGYEQKGQLAKVLQRVIRSAS